MTKDSIALRTRHIVNVNSDFLCFAFLGLADKETPWVTGFPGDPHLVNQTLWGGRPALPLPQFIRPHHNNYVAVSSFKRGSDGRYHRRKANFSRMFMVMVDDIGTKVAEHNVKLAASAVVETSPGNYQAWYFLDPPESDAKKAERLVEGMIANGLTADASDPGMRGLTRYGRLPEGVNGKAKYVERLGAPFVQRVTSWDPSVRYAVEEIAKAYGVDLTLHPTRKSAVPRQTTMRIGDTADDSNECIAVLVRAGLYLEPHGSLVGAHRIVCPWLYQHTDEDPSGTVYFEPSEENAWRGGFKCHHGHCQQRTLADLRAFVRQLQAFADGATS